MWDKALEYVNKIKVPIKEFGSYKDHAEKNQMGILKKKNNTVEGIPPDRDERLMEFTNMLTNSSNIENTKLTIFKSMPSIVGELSICEQYALKQQRQEKLQQRQIRAHQAILYEWQREIEMEINREPDERIIFHYVDPKGGKGKTFVQKNLKDKYPERIFQFIDGKATDVYHQLHKHQTRYGQAPNVIFYNITRFQYNQENFINYSAIEDIKDGLVRCFLWKQSTCIHFLKPKFGIPLHVFWPMEETHLYKGHKISENQKTQKDEEERKMLHVYMARFVLHWRPYQRIESDSTFNTKEH